MHKVIHRYVKYVNLAKNIKTSSESSNGYHQKLYENAMEMQTCTNIKHSKIVRECNYAYAQQ